MPKDKLSRIWFDLWHVNSGFYTPLGTWVYRHKPLTTFGYWWRAYHLWFVLFPAMAGVIYLVFFGFMSCVFGG